MVKLKRQELAAEARRLNQEQLASLGGRVRAARIRRGLTQAQLGSRVGISRATVGALERGHGGGHTVDTWQRIAVALDLRLRIELQRDVLEDPEDVGHLAIQELILRVARRRGTRGSFELPVRSSASRHSIDVFLRDDEQRWLIVVECVNVLNDIGAMARNFDWKLSKAGEAAVAIGGESPYEVRGCVVVRATSRNRSLIGRFANVFEAHWPGSSARWVSS
jgi:transcriptional regulator with XRE-family HTH domain